METSHVDEDAAKGEQSGEKEEEFTTKVKFPPEITYQAIFRGSNTISLRFEGLIQG